MNKDGRKRIDAIMKDIEATATKRDEINSAIDDLNDMINEYKESFSDIAAAIEELKDEEQEKYDNLSEGLQQSEKGQVLEATVSQLETAYEAVSNIEFDDVSFDFDADEVVSALDEAKYAG